MQLHSLCSFSNRELKQTRRRQKRERHLKMCLRVSAIMFQLFKVIMLGQCVLTVLEFNCNQRWGTFNLSSYAHVVHAIAEQVISRRRKHENFFKMSNIEKCTRKACKSTVFHCKICKFVGFLLRSSSWLLKLPNDVGNAKENAA